MDRLNLYQANKDDSVHKNTWGRIVTDRFNIYSGASNPTLAEIPQGQWIVYKNTTTGEIKLWVNDNGTLKSTVAFT